ncbi:MAG: translation initiation factor IF-2 subunit beta [Thermoproteota archaeon]|nr:translation initiation factor IF-2 subunit beta [Candidatus Brockarchaeota archaeon]
MIKENDSKKDYLEWLDRGLSKVPRTESRDRLNVPSVECINEKNKTIIQNLNQIADILNRDPKHILKYITLRLATSYSEIGEGRYILKGRILDKQLDSVISDYIKAYVECPVCKRPDTKLSKEKRNIIQLVCLSCGAVSPVKSL